jgi:Domain of unknown function (DUF4304)
LIPAVREITEAIDASLRPKGFTQRKAAWNRSDRQLVDVIDLQVSKDSEAVTLNCGVFDPAVHSATWAKDRPKFVGESECTVRARIGALLGERDLWWPLDDPAQTASELASLVRTTVLPFLEEMHDSAEFDAFLARTVEGKRYPDMASQVYRAVRMHERGDDAAARALLREVAESPSAWHERAIEVASRLFPDTGLH